MGCVDIHLNDVTFLVYYLDVGIVKEGYQYFKSMNDYYFIIPVMEHLCMVYLIRFVGHLYEIKDFINTRVCT